MFTCNSAKILKMKISAVIIAGNEEAKIADAIRSVNWADEVLVIDSESSDRTREIAQGLGARALSSGRGMDLRPRSSLALTQHHLTGF